MRSLLHPSLITIVLLALLSTAVFAGCPGPKPGPEGEGEAPEDQLSQGEPEGEAPPEGEPIPENEPPADGEDTPEGEAPPEGEPMPEGGPLAEGEFASEGQFMQEGEPPSAGEHVIEGEDAGEGAAEGEIEAPGLHFANSPNEVAIVGEEFLYAPVVKGAAADVAYALLEGPADMVLDPASGVLTWIPAEAAPFTDILIEASDGVAATQQHFAVIALESVRLAEATIGGAEEELALVVPDGESIFAGVLVNVPAGALLPGGGVVIGEVQNFGNVFGDEEGFSGLRIQVHGQAAEEVPVFLSMPDGTLSEEAMAALSVWCYDLRSRGWMEASKTDYDSEEGVLSFVLFLGNTGASGTEKVDLQTPHDIVIPHKKEDRFPPIEISLFRARNFQEDRIAGQPPLGIQLSWPGNASHDPGLAGIPVNHWWWDFFHNDENVQQAYERAGSRHSFGKYGFSVDYIIHIYAVGGGLFGTDRQLGKYRLRLTNVKRTSGDDGPRWLYEASLRDEDIDHERDLFACNVSKEDGDRLMAGESWLMPTEVPFGAADVFAVKASFAAGTFGKSRNVRDTITYAKVRIAADGFGEVQDDRWNGLRDAIEYGDPDIDFSATPRITMTGDTVWFSDYSDYHGCSLDLADWSWSFGNGRTSHERHLAFTYDAPGEYSVSLEARTHAGRGSCVKEDYISVWQLPTAAFFASTRECYAGDTVAFTDESDPGYPAAHTYRWDFGEGNPMNGDPGAQHTYRSPGEFTVLLNVVSEAGSDAAAQTLLVKPVPPVVHFESGLTSGTAPLTVNFGDATVAGTYPIIEWRWEVFRSFADTLVGQETFRRPADFTYTFENGGHYHVALTVTTDVDNREYTERKLDFVFVTDAPVAPMADFRGEPRSGSAPLSVAFFDRSNPGSAVITHWSWDFGDGGTRTGQNPTYTYTRPGTYTVRLSITSSAGTDSENKPDYVVVSSPGEGEGGEEGEEMSPTAAFSASPESGPAPLTVNFTDTSDPGSATISAWYWEFGDGNTSTQQHPTHTYTEPGTYHASLSVNTPVGSDTRAQTVTAGTPLAEALDNNTLTWATSGNAYWFGQSSETHDGTDAARSGTRPFAISSTLTGTVEGPGKLRFWWKVSCGSSRFCDLKFRVDGEVSSIIADFTDWRQETCYVDSGMHTFTWTYANSNLGGLAGRANCGWVDQVEWIPGTGGEGEGEGPVEGEGPGEGEGEEEGEDGWDFSVDTPVALPDRYISESNLDFAPNLIISDVDVLLDITHTIISELHVSLISPDGTVVQLFGGIGGRENRLDGTILDDSAATAIADGSAPFTGSYVPDGSLSDLIGERARGRWVLQIKDDEDGDTGTLSVWALRIQGEPIEGEGEGEGIGEETCLRTDYESGDLSLAIPDREERRSTMVVNSIGRLDDVNVSLDVSHTWVSELQVQLLSPDGTNIDLFSNVGGDGDNFTDTVFDDDAPTPITYGSAPFTGSYFPEAPLSAVNGERAHGQWTLIVYDGEWGDVGRLNNWSLELCVRLGEGEGEGPPAEGEEPPLEGEGPPDEGERPPDEGEEPTEDGEPRPDGESVPEGELQPEGEPQPDGEPSQDGEPSADGEPSLDGEPQR